MSLRSVFLPATRPGKWSVGLAIVFGLCVWLKIRGSPPVPTFGVMALGAAAFALAMYAIYRRKDLSILGMLPVVAGLLVSFWLSTELAPPF